MLKRLFAILLLLLPAGYSLWRIPSSPLFYAVTAVAALLGLAGYLAIRNFRAGLFIQLGLAFVFLDLAFDKVDWNYFDDFVRKIDLRFILPIVACIGLNLCLRALKWRMLFRKPPSASSLFPATFIGFMANTIFPARAGELVRAWIVADREKLSMSQSLTTIFLERLMDGLTLMVFFILLLAAAPLDRSHFLSYGILAVVLYCLVLAVFIVYFLKSALIEGWILGAIRVLFRTNRRRRDRFIKNGLAILRKVREGLHLFKDLKSLAGFFLLTLLNWGIILFTIYLINRSVGLLAMFQITGVSWFYSSLFLLLMICFALSIPAGPGGAGPYQKFVMISLLTMNPLIAGSGELYAKAAGFSIYLWLIQGLPVIIMGVIFYIFSGYSIGRLRKAAS